MYIRKENEEIMIQSQKGNYKDYKKILYMTINTFENELLYQTI